MIDSPSQADAPLLFEWGPATREKFLITVFLVGSLFLHALAFYLFRIIYPPAIAVLPPPARLNLIGTNSEEGRSLLRWIEAEDPALASATLRPGDGRSRALPKLEHVPSYVVQEPQLKDPPPMPSNIATPEAFPPGPASIATKTEPAWPKMATHAAFSEELGALGNPTLAAPRFAASISEPPENVRFRIAVDQHGEIRYCFRLNSSGDSSLDEQARLWLVRSRFSGQPATSNADVENLIWGVATVQWGNDVSQPQSAEKSSAASP